MPPKSKKCSLCGSTSSVKWILLDRKNLCENCYDLQCNPPLEPQEIKDEPVAGPSGLGRKSEAIVATNSESVPCNPSDEVSVKETPVTQPARMRKRNLAYTAPFARTTTTHRLKQPNRNRARKTGPGKVTLTDETTRPKSVQKVRYENFWYEVGDIVSLVDTKDKLYYAQIRGLVEDVLNQKSAVLTWLVPTAESPPSNESFDPSTYIIGPEEDMLRDLSQMRFVMHAPSGYYFNRTCPYPRKIVSGPVVRDGRTTVEPAFDWANICQLHLTKSSAEGGGGGGAGVSRK